MLILMPVGVLIAGVRWYLLKSNSKLLPVCWCSTTTTNWRLAAHLKNSFERSNEFTDGRTDHWVMGPAYFRLSLGCNSLGTSGPFSGRSVSGGVGCAMLVGCGVGPLTVGEWSSLKPE